MSTILDDPDFENILICLSFAATSMTDSDRYSFLQMLELHAARYIVDVYDADFKLIIR